MKIIWKHCPACNSPRSLGNPWRGPDGQVWQTCFGLNRPEHPGVKFHFDAVTGEARKPTDGVHACILACLSEGEQVPLRGFSDVVLAHHCGVTVIPAKKLDLHTAVLMPQLGMWAREMEEGGLLISQLPIHRGPRLVGLQFRALRPVLDKFEDVHKIRVFGGCEGLYIPYFIGCNPMAIIIHEGPWGAVAATNDALKFQNTDLLSVATLSAGVAASTIKSTLDAVFPGVPRFSLFDQDPAGILARMATMGVAKPILISGAGNGKDYRDLNRDLRFERLTEIIARELRQLEGGK